MTFSSSCICEGVPSAIFSPKFSTMIRSEIDITAAMSCSTRRTVTPRSLTDFTRETMFFVSSMFIPANGSSSSRATGSVESPIAIPSARRWPCGRLRARSPEISDIPRKERTSSARRPKLSSSWRAAPVPRKYPASDADDLRCCARMTLSLTVMSLNMLVS